VFGIKWNPYFSIKWNCTVYTIPIRHSFRWDCRRDLCWSQRDIAQMQESSGKREAKN
jgi:hypothetical protein